jgi:hypothetical protein
MVLILLMMYLPILLMRVVISTTDVDVRDNAPASANLPAGVDATGEDFGTNNQAGSGVESGTPSMSIAVTTATTNITGVNFGLNDFNILQEPYG